MQNQPQDPNQEQQPKPETPPAPRPERRSIRPQPSLPREEGALARVEQSQPAKSQEQPKQSSPEPPAPPKPEPAHPEPSAPRRPIPQQGDQRKSDWPELPAEEPSKEKPAPIPEPKPKELKPKTPPPVSEPPSASPEAAPVKEEPSVPADVPSQKQEFLRREEVRTMEKDIAALRSKEAATERERIASIKEGAEPVASNTQASAPEPKQESPSFSPPQQSQLPKEAATPSARPSGKQKLVIRLFIAASLILLLGNGAFFGYKYFFAQEEEQAPVQEPVLEQEEEEPESEPEESAEEPVAPEPRTFTIQDRFVSWGTFTPSSPRSISSIIVHSAYNAETEDPYDSEALLNTFRGFQVTYHYLILRDGSILRLVPESSVAYHAKSGALGINLNASSIGIGLVYTETESPSDIQYEALAYLISDIETRYPSVEEAVAGYNQVNQTKETPWNFDWERLRSLLSSEE